VDVDQVLAGAAAGLRIGDAGAGGRPVGTRRLVPARLGQAAAVVRGRGDAEAVVLGRGASRGDFVAGRDRRLRRRLGRRGAVAPSPTLARGGDQLADRRRHLGRKPLQLARIVAGRKESRDPLLQRQPRQLRRLLLDPAAERAGGAVGVAAGDVEQAPHRLRVATGLAGGGVDRRVAAGQVGPLQVGDARQPAVAEPTGQRQHARFVGADPERDRVRRGRPAGGAAQLVVLALEADAAALAAVPERAQDRDRLRQGVDRRAGSQPRPAHRLDRVPEGTGAEPELDPAVAEEVEAGRRPRDDRRRAQRQVQHVGGERHPVGAGGEVGEQRPGVEEARLVGVVLEADDVEPQLLGQFGHPHDQLRPLVRRREEDSELELVPVVSHAADSRDGGVPARRLRQRNGLTTCSGLRYSVSRENSVVA